MRCIDADKLHYKKVYISSGWDVSKPSIVVFAREIDKMPTFEIVEQSKWVKKEDRFECEKCHNVALNDNLNGNIVLSAYCPSCGRKMVKILE